MHIGLITTNAFSGTLFKNVLESLFCGQLKVNSYSEDAPHPHQWDSRDIFRVISVNYLDHGSVIPSDRPKIYMALTLRKDKLVALNDIERGTKVLLVETTSRHAVTVIDLFYKLGIAHLEFLPYYPGCTLPQGIDIAVTPSKNHLVPKEIKKVFDIGYRTPDIQTILEIASRTGLENVLTKQPFLDHYKSLTGNNLNTLDSVISACRLHKEYETIMDAVDIGIVGINDKNYIHTCNRKAIALLNKQMHELIFQSINPIVSLGIIEKCKAQKVPLKIQIKDRNNQKLSAMITPIMQNNMYLGAIIMMQSMDGDESFQKVLMEKFIQKGYQAKYKFSDIIGDSPAIKYAIQLAEKMALTESPILIYGENGTGKELFAHSIHNSSNRANKPFMAINCAAIQDSLIESELFGYERGSFTGAKKDGKIGLLEIANRGTVFLDEVEAMSPSLQAKLLRVIQENEFMRVGGNTILPIDVRFICATNQELAERVQNGSFRQDLYYRINTLPIEIPPLRKRYKDICLLFAKFQSQLQGKFILNKKVEEYLIEYTWPGNVRELRNCVEYLSCLGEYYIEEQHLPKNITKKANEDVTCLKNTAIKAIAQILNESSCGRHGLSRSLTQYGIDMTDAKVRSLLNDMKKMGWVETQSGRAGTFLTEIGKRELISKIECSFNRR